jgi:hypothetical protein
MLLLRYLLIASCFGLFASVAGMVLYDIYLACELDRLLSRRDKQPEDSEANRIQPAVQAEGDEIRLPAAARKVSPSRMQTVAVPNDRKFFFPNDALTQAVARDSASPLAGPLTRR